MTQDDNVIEVSPEMTVVLGPPDAPMPVPPCPVALTISLSPEVCSFEVQARPQLDEIAADAGPNQIVFLVRREAVERIGGAGLLSPAGSGFHLSTELRSIALALREPPTGPEARSTYRLAKSIEFLCEAIRAFSSGALAPVCGDGALSADDTRRVIAARRIIEERAAEKLTLESIARSCGLNRSKLTRGFKVLFDCTVAQAIADQRLEVARRMLLTTDLPVSSVGYESGYLNNASFARAFGRRFGRSPSDFRTQALAA